MRFFTSQLTVWATRQDLQPFMQSGRLDVPELERKLREAFPIADRVYVGQVDCDDVRALITISFEREKRSPHTLDVDVKPEFDSNEMFWANA